MPTKFAITFTASFRVSWKCVEREEIVDQKATIMVIHFDNYSYFKKNLYRVLVSSEQLP